MHTRYLHRIWNLTGYVVYGVDIMYKRIISLFLIMVFLAIGTTNVFAAEIDDGYDYVVSTYTIACGSDKSNSVINCKLAAKEIDGTILEPDEEFSFNDIVGRRTAEKGYKSGTIISNGKRTTGIGGGICMLATCIFNAALEGNFKITERHYHSLKMGYVPEGRDASIYWETADLKFKNNYDVPIKVSIEFANKKMTVSLLSKEKVKVPDAKVKTRLIKGIYYTYRYVGWDINYVTKSIYKG